MTLHESSLRIILRDNFKGRFFMSEKMLVTQALDERDLLVKKISDKIDKASFVDTIKPNEDKVYSKRIGKDEYAKEAESAYQQIVDLIERFQKIDAAIVASNAETEITTSYGKFTVAGAISLRSRLRGLGTYDGEADFEGMDEFTERFGLFGNKLQTEKELEENRKRGGGGTIHFMDELPEYKEISDKYREEEKRLEEYRRKCKDEAIDMLKQYFYDLWD